MECGEGLSVGGGCPGRTWRAWAGLGRVRPRVLGIPSALLSLSGMNTMNQLVLAGAQSMMILQELAVLEDCDESLEVEMELQQDGFYEVLGALESWQAVRCALELAGSCGEVPREEQKKGGVGLSQMLLSGLWLAGGVEMEAWAVTLVAGWWSGS